MLQAHQVRVDQAGQQELPDLRAQAVPVVRQGLRVQVDHRDHQGRLVQRVSLVPADLLAQAELLVLPVHQGLLAQLDLQDLQDPQGLVGHLELHQTSNALPLLAIGQSLLELLMSLW